MPEQYDPSAYNPALDKLSAGAKHSKAWDEYKTHGTANRSAKDDEDDGTNNNNNDNDNDNNDNDNKMIVSKDKLIQEKSYGKVGKTVWDKKAHGGKYYISSGEGSQTGYDALEQHPDGAVIKKEPGYEKPQSGHTTNFVGNHMTQGAIDLVQHELTRVDPLQQEERMKRLDLAKGIKREPPKLLKVEKKVLKGGRDGGDDDDDTSSLLLLSNNEQEEVYKKSIDRYTWEEKDSEIIIRIPHDQKLMDLKSAQLEVQNERSFTVTVRSTCNEKMYTLVLPNLFSSIVREMTQMLTTEKYFRITLVKSNVGQKWKTLSAAASEKILRLDNSPALERDNNNEERGLILKENNNGMNMRDLRAEVIKFRDGKLAPKFKTQEEIENELESKVEDADVTTPMEFTSHKEAMKFCEHFESTGDHANAIKAFSSALFFLRFFTSSSSFSDSDGNSDSSKNITTVNNHNNNNAGNDDEKEEEAMELKIIDCLKRRAKANASLGKIGTAANDYAEAILEGKKLLLLVTTTKNETKKLVSNLYFERGNAHEQIEKYAKAVDDYKNALMLGGNDVNLSMALTRASKLHFQRDIERKARMKNTSSAALKSLPRPGMKQFENRGKSGACF